MLQGCKRELMFILIAGDSHVDFGCPFVVGQPDVRNSYCAQPRILELIPDNLRNLLANRICDSLTTGHVAITTAGSSLDVRGPRVCRASQPNIIELAKPVYDPTYDKLKSSSARRSAPDYS